MMKTLVLMVALVGCYKSNPNYCPDHPDNNCSEAIDATGSGDGNANCAVTGCVGGVCDMSKNMCVECTPANTSACTGTAPICALDETCQPCGGDGECTASGVCRADGSCALVSNVLYASPSGGAAAACTQLDKCSLAHALTLVDTTKTIVHLDAGSYPVGGLSLTQTVTIVGRDAVIDRSGMGVGPVISVGAGNTVTLELVKITGGNSSATSDGIYCLNASLLVHSAKIEANSGYGIDVTTCDVTIDRTTIFNNTNGGVQIASATTTLKFDLSNNFITRNGNTTTGQVGGLTIVPTIVGTSRLEFNTIVDNFVTAGSSHAGGVVCDVTNFHASSNIIARNTKASSPSETFGSCDYPTSDVQDTVAGLDFASPDVGPYSYKIGASSAAKDQATTPSAVDIDVDGDHRPQGQVKDIGADEYKAP